MANNIELTYRPSYWEAHPEDATQTGYYFRVFATQSKNPAGGTSTIRWSIARDWYETDKEYYDVGPTKLTIDGQVVYEKPRLDASTEQFPCARGEEFGYIVVHHDADKTKTVQITLETAVTSTDIDTITVDWELDPFAGASTVTQNPVQVGDTAVCIINSGEYQYRHTVTYTFGSHSGTIVTKEPAGAYAWQIPDTFYDEFAADEVSKTGTLTCVTYKDNFSSAGIEGTTTTPFIVRIGDENAPMFSVVLEDTDATVTALTGDPSVMVVGYSDVKYTITAQAQNGATIAAYSASTPQGTLTTATGTFANSMFREYEFTVTDSRGLTSKRKVLMSGTTPSYSRPSVNISNAELSSEGKLTFDIGGIWWDYKFGELAASQNTLKSYYRYKVKGGNYSNWIEVPVVESGDCRFEMTVEITGLNYQSQYTIQAKVIDRLTERETAEYVVVSYPVFDWSGEDFNFNVPVNFSAGTTGASADGGVLYGVCSIGGTVAAKTVQISGYQKTVTGSNVRIKFEAGNTIATPTLNVNGTGAYPIVKYGSTDGLAYMWYAGEVKDFVFDGSYWVLVDGGVATTSFYGKTVLSDTIDTSTGKAATPKAVKNAIDTAIAGITAPEVGTWTPSCSGSGTKTGWYIKSGSLLILGFYISVTTGSTSNMEISIGGMPYSLRSVAGGGGYCSSYVYSTTAAFAGWEWSGSYITAIGATIPNLGTSGTAKSIKLCYPLNTTMVASGTICAYVYE